MDSPKDAVELQQQQKRRVPKKTERRREQNRESARRHYYKTLVRYRIGCDWLVQPRAHIQLSLSLCLLRNGLSKASRC